MKRLILILLTGILTVSLLTGCKMFPKEGQIVFSLEEERESACVWNCFIEPDGVVEKVRDEVFFSDDGTLHHDWIFEGVEVGEVAITLQYSEEGKDPARTVRYSCYVDEKLHVNLLETEDSADEAGTAEDELLIQCISAALSLQYGQGMAYPTNQVTQEYAQAFLNCCANLFYSEKIDEKIRVEGTNFAQYIPLDKERVAELLSIAFGDRFGMLDANQNSVISREHDYCFGVQEYAWVDAIPLDGELQYVFTVQGVTESIDGTALLEVSETSENRVGLAIADIHAQKSE